MPGAMKKLLTAPCVLLCTALSVVLGQRCDNNLLSSINMCQNYANMTTEFWPPANFSVADAVIWDEAIAGLKTEPPRCRNVFDSEQGSNHWQTNCSIESPTLIYPVNGTSVLEVVSIDDVQRTASVVVKFNLLWWDPIAVYINSRNPISWTHQGIWSIASKGATPMHASHAIQPAQIISEHVHLNPSDEAGTQTSMQYRAVRREYITHQFFWQEHWYPFDNRRLVFEWTLPLLPDGYQFAVPNPPDPAAPTQLGGWHNLPSLTVPQSDVQQLLSMEWETTSDLVWEVCNDYQGNLCSDRDHATEYGQPLMKASVSVRRNYSTMVVDAIIPIMCTTLLAYLTLFMPTEMAMPRVATTLLALVSSMGMSKVVQSAVPPGACNWLSWYLSMGVITKTQIGAVHCYIFYMDYRVTQKPLSARKFLLRQRMLCRASRYAIALMAVTMQLVCPNILAKLADGGYSGGELQWMFLGMVATSLFCVNLWLYFATELRLCNESPPTEEESQAQLEMHQNNQRREARTDSGITDLTHPLPASALDRGLHIAKHPKRSAEDDGASQEAGSIAEVQVGVLVEVSDPGNTQDQDPGLSGFKVSVDSKPAVSGNGNSNDNTKSSGNNGVNV